MNRGQAGMLAIVQGAEPATGDMHSKRSGLVKREAKGRVSNLARQPQSKPKGMKFIKMVGRGCESRPAS